ncbi:MAG: PASTA domain-containing protein [Candidatus Latescibacteria bacterium]|nr:PASTA domain-containing protein [Candidatus Latescibacterota bacterium]
MRASLTEDRGSGDLLLIFKTVGLLILLLVIIALFFLGGMIVVDRVVMPAFTKLGSEVELPDIVDQDFYAAKRALTELGLELEKIEEEFSPVYEEGHIIEQTPPPFTKVKRGRTVGVVVSRGPEEIVIPDLTRLSEDQARAKLREFGLLLGSVTSRPDNAPEGTVIDQRPVANVKSLRKRRVDLVISSGPARLSVRIPLLVNEGLGRALDIIRELNGLVWIEWVEDDESMMMTVIGQSPEPGSEVEGKPIFDLRVAIRTGFTPAPPDTVGIGAPPPLIRRLQFPPFPPLALRSAGMSRRPL